MNGLIMTDTIKWSSGGKCVPGIDVYAVTDM